MKNISNQLRQIFGMTPTIDIVAMKDAKIRALEKIIDEYRITESAIRLAKGRLELLKTMNSANDDFVIIEGEGWEIPIHYDRWTTYQIGDSVCRLIGIYLNDESTLIINEFPECYFPPHYHYHTETCVVMKGEIEMNDVTYQVGETAHFKADEPHWLKTKSSTIAVIWNTKLTSIKGN